MRTETADVVIVGAGSGGFGVAIRAARDAPKARVVVIEAGDQFGGTSTAGGVNCWETGIGGPGVHHELYALLRDEPDAVGVGMSTHVYAKDAPYGLSQVAPDSTYAQSLRRSALPKTEWGRVHFEPARMSAAMETLLRRAGNVSIRYHTRFLEAHTEGRRVLSVVVAGSDGEPYHIAARCFADCSGGVFLARAAGCAADFGEDAAAKYGEPNAPAVARAVVNGVSQIVRVAPTDAPGVEPLPPFARHPAVALWAEEHHPATQINEYPNGDLNLNILPVMEGGEFHALPHEEAVALCRGRALAHWRWLQREHGFAGYRFAHLFPLVGVRESHRLVGRCVLREQDVRAGLLAQPHRESLIAFADHALDTHGQTNVRGAHLKELDQPYGVPYDCLLPQEYDNLIVASRGASFSHIAAASCRLSRTMIALGEAAGVATALALGGAGDYGAVPVAAVREWLGLPAFEAHIVREWGLAMT